jgi:hypothetical protein
LRQRPRWSRRCKELQQSTRASHTSAVWIGNVANGESDYRFLHYANEAFTTNDSSKLAWQRKDDNWWVSVNGREFYFIPDALIHGG